MAVLEGNTTGSISTVPFNIAATLISGYLVNRTSGDVIVNMYIATSTGDRSVIPVNLTLMSGTMWIMEEKIILKPGYYFIIVTNGSLDYYFSLE